MFLLGIGPGDRDNGSRVVAIRMFLKNIKKHYEVVNHIFLPMALSHPEMITEISRLYLDNAYISNKRIFSQDKRPTRTIRANPRLVVYGDLGGGDLTRSLRAQKIPVECITPQIALGWEKYTYGKALGDDYRVCKDTLLDTLVKLYVQNRLVFKKQEEKMIQPLENLKAELDQHPLSPEHLFKGFELENPLVVLSLPLWFREDIPYNRSYKA